jgi:hypothetical protein
MLRIPLAIALFFFIVCPPLWADWGQFGQYSCPAPSLRTNCYDNAYNCSRPYSFIWQHPTSDQCQYFQPDAAPWFTFSGRCYPTVMPLGTTGNGYYNPYPYYNPSTSGQRRPGACRESYDSQYYNNSGNYTSRGSDAMNYPGAVIWLDPYCSPCRWSQGGQDSWSSPWRPPGSWNGADQNGDNVLPLQLMTPVDIKPEFRLQRNPADNTYQYKRPGGVVTIDPNTGIYRVGAPAEENSGQKPTFRIKYDPVTKSYVIKK